VAPGSSGTSVITITPKITGNPFPAIMTFACSGLPNLSSCSFSPPTVSASQGFSATTSVQASVQTTAPALVGPRPDARRPSPQGFETWSLAGLAAVLASLLLLGRRRGAGPVWRYAAAALVIAAMAGLASACGGGGSKPPSNGGTPNGTYTITVTATSGSAVEKTTFTFRVHS
jgi:hypothetical protein